MFAERRVNVLSCTVDNSCWRTRIEKQGGTTPPQDAVMFRAEKEFHGVARVLGMFAAEWPCGLNRDKNVARRRTPPMPRPFSR